MNTTKHDRHGAVAGQVDCRVRPLVDRLRAAALPGTNRRVLDEEAAAEIELLREMLEAAERRRQAAQPAAEPVAHQYLFHSPFGGEVWHDSPRERNGSKPHGHRALYAHPAPAAQPAAEPASQRLTDEQIEEIFQEATGADEGTALRFARAIEAAHGIGKETP